MYQCTHVTRCHVSVYTCNQMSCISVHMYPDVMYQCTHVTRCHVSVYTCNHMSCISVHMYPDVVYQCTHVTRCHVSVYTCIQMSCISVHMYPDVRYVILCFDCHAKLFSLAFSILYLISLYTYDRITYIK
jgi:hypothetical protein